MEKKVYIKPSIMAYQMSSADGILYTGSNEKNGILGDGGTTSEGGVSKGDTKASGSWNVWSSDDE